MRWNDEMIGLFALKRQNGVEESDAPGIIQSRTISDAGKKMKKQRKPIGKHGIVRN